MAPLILYPHALAVSRGERGTIATFPESTGLVALAQWGLATALFAFATRRLSAWQQAWMAPLVVLGTAVVVALVASACGLGFDIDWL